MGQYATRFSQQTCDEFLDEVEGESGRQNPSLTVVFLSSNYTDTPFTIIS